MRSSQLLLTTVDIGPVQVGGIQAYLMVPLASLKLYGFAPTPTIQTPGIFSISLRVVCNVGTKCVYQNCKRRATPDYDGFLTVSMIVFLDSKARLTNRALDHTPNRQPCGI